MPNLSDLSLEMLSAVLKDRDIFNLSNVYVAGIEVTQAIQWYEARQHLTDKSDQGPDNGVTLVANKPAWVRVYIGGFIAHSGVTGTLTMQRRNAHFAWEDVGVLDQQGYSSVNYDPGTSYAETRRRLYHTLNFVIPAGKMRGNFRVVAKIESARGSSASGYADVDATLLQTLQIRGIPIRYWGKNTAGNSVQIGPTTAAEFASTATWAMLTYPVENVPSITLAGIFTWSETLAGPAVVPGGCSTGWNDLLYWLQLAKVIDGTKPGVIYYGLLPAATPNGPVIGCDIGGASAGISGDGITMAHEMGHYQGFPHSPCGNVGTPDANYPAYEPYDTVGARIASIGEFGLDVSTGAIYDPATTKDYMSYCGPQWTSLYHYNAQMGSSWFNPRYVSSGDRPAWWDHYQLYRKYSIPRDLPRPGPVEEFLVHERTVVQLEPSIVVTGMLHDGQLDIRSVLRVDAARGSGDRGEELLEILDAGGTVIASGAFHYSPVGACGGNSGGSGHDGGCGCGCGGLAGGRSECPRVVQAILPDVDGAAAMRVVRRGEVVWKREAPKRVHALDEVRAEVGHEEMAVEWHVSEGEVSETHLQLSSDRGETWSLLELGVRSTTTKIPLNVLPPGRHLVRVLVSNGFHTVTSKPVDISVPARPPVATIHWPLDGATVTNTAKMRLWGNGMSAGTEALPDRAHAWAIDGTEMGVGHDVWITPPMVEGEHVATLTVRDRHGETSISSRFWISASGLAPRLQRSSR
ncbi:hypothetical protein C8J98_102160 [Luteibacter sp. OK325]|uniref:hypothetical protein n=1 Tax=Luteibacter sp. OK325 TaxID=2135670 RepID=UPI000D38B99D|nr:hypothetical protein [Luteibacter sp. OK325]PTR33973.1 hypothetical protein C8J98_102160 [Luteibacter sp. OK325]